MKRKKYYILLLIILLSIALVFTSGDAKVTGNCANCHTMHNSQNGTAMATYGADGKTWKGTGPFKLLVRGDCLGCHGMGTANKIVTIGGSEIPQVYHTDATDLAGGNFAYITGAKARGTGGDQNNVGHNVIDLGAAYKEGVLGYAPGFLITQHNLVLTKDNITCAGYVGCHGSRNALDNYATGIPKLKGAHHKNADGICNTDPATAEAYNSYRFLVGVKGLENTGPYKWQNYNANNHNEYFMSTLDKPPRWNLVVNAMVLILMEQLLLMVR